MTERILIHNATAYIIVDINEDGKKTYSEPIELHRVRCIPVQTALLDSNGLNKDDRLTLYFNAKKSLPLGFIPLKQMRIDFNGESYSIREVSPMYAGKNEVEHYEVQLV